MNRCVGEAIRVTRCPGPLCARVPARRAAVRAGTIGRDDLDLLFRGGVLIDGSGAPARPPDVGAAGDRVAAVGHLSGVADVDVATVIDARGLAVASGLIDPHEHADLSVLVDGALASHLGQGYTTQSRATSVRRQVCSPVRMERETGFEPATCSLEGCRSAS